MGQMNVKIDVGQLKDRVCAKCGGMFFASALIVKEMSPVVSPSGKYESMMIPVGFACVGCGTIMSLRPEPPKEAEKEESNIVMLKG